LLQRPRRDKPLMANKSKRIEAVKIDAVIFDLDDTLIDWAEQSLTYQEFNRPKIEHVRRYLLGCGHRLPAASEFFDIVNTAMRETWVEAKQDRLIPSLGEVFCDIFLRLGLDVDQIDRDEVLRRYDWGPVPGVAPYPDTIEVLDALRDRGYKIGLLTNSFLPMWMRDVELRAFGLIEYLDVRLSSGDVGYLKPHPAIYQAILEMLEASPNRSVFVGDRPHDDIAGANESGLISVLIDPPHLDRELNGVQPDFTITRLSELLPILEGLTSPPGHPSDR
jgi:HAD superfamily hydrolase (TIGR01509 family)